MDDDKLLELGVQGIKDAASRARIAFFITVFACGTILITIYNNYFAWNRIVLEPNRGLVEWTSPSEAAKSIKDPMPPSSLSGSKLDEWNVKLDLMKKKKVDESHELHLESHKQDARDVAENQGITISLLGIRLSSGDLDIFGSVGLLMISMYYLLCVRRMSLEIESMYEESSGLVLVQQRYVYAGVRQSYVLNTSVEEDAPNQVASMARSERAITISRWIFPKATFLPLATVVIMIASDWWYILGEMGRDYGSSAWWWGHLSAEYRNQFLIMDAFAAAVAVLILAMNLSTFRLQRTSAIILVKFKSDLDAAVKKAAEERQSIWHL